MRCPLGRQEEGATTHGATQIKTRQERNQDKNEKDGFESVFTLAVPYLISIPSSLLYRIHWQKIANYQRWTIHLVSFATLQFWILTYMLWLSLLMVNEKQQ